MQYFLNDILIGDAYYIEHMTASAALRKFGTGSIALPRVVLASYPLRTAAVVVALSIVIVGISFFSVAAQTVPLQNLMGIGGGVSAAVASSTFSSGSVTTTVPMHEVHIANDGLMLVRGAMVTSITNGTITVSIAWSGSTFNWTVETDSNTKFITSTGEKGTLNAIQVGNYVDVTGMLTQGGATPTIAAEFVRE